MARPEFLREKMAGLLVVPGSVGALSNTIYVLQIFG